MENIDPNGYSVLRFGGASQARACAELGVNSGRGQALEARFLRVRGGEGADAMRPRFARHAKHVEAVLSAGGYPAMPR
jgi:hypothetical protein